MSNPWETYSHPPFEGSLLAVSTPWLKGPAHKTTRTDPNPNLNLPAESLHPNQTPKLLAVSQ